MSTVLENVTNKRKSDAEPTTVAKKSRTSKTTDADAQAGAKNLVAHINMFPNSFELPEDDGDVREMLVKLAAYARMLEQAGKAATAAKGGASSALGVIQPKKTPEQLEAAAEKVKAAARSGITKQMAWKPTCKEGRAKWAYDGVCNDPDVFANLMGSESRITWKMKKFSIDEFETLLGGKIRKPVRYDNLYLRGAGVTVRWDESEGTFKFSGSYGK